MENIPEIYGRLSLTTPKLNFEFWNLASFYNASPTLATGSLAEKRKERAATTFAEYPSASRRTAERHEY